MNAADLFMIALLFYGESGVSGHDLKDQDVSISVSPQMRTGSGSSEERCTKDSCMKTKRYLLYDVNPGEGFNLRRDVYLRAAVFVHELNIKDQKAEWTLVLPPWGPLYHWKHKELNQEGLPWELFFDLESVNKFVPVMEFDEYLAVRKQPLIDHIFYLLSYNYDEVDLQSEWLLDETNCADLAAFPYFYDGEKNVRGAFWGYDGIFAKRLNCYKALGSASSVIPKLLAKVEIKERAVMFDRFETVLHDHFGGLHYWQARRSMRFAAPLVKIGDDFRKNVLNSSDDLDNTPLDSNWQNQKSISGSATGGPYVCAHLRRQDYLRARSEEVPSIREAALRLRKLLQSFDLDTVFVATDGTAEEIKELRINLPSVTVFTYAPTKDVLRKIKEGGAAIVEQWICIHSRYFIGSHESTFSFRIQEEREILGFDPDTTFNRFCKVSDKPCEQPTRWRIVV